MAPHRRQVTRLGEKANVKAITRERLDEWRSSAVLDGGEPQKPTFMRPTLTCLALLCEARAPRC
jgi:hypothetical protein